MSEEEEEEGDGMSEVDEDLSTSHLRREAAGSVGVSQTGNKAPAGAQSGQKRRAVTQTDRGHGSKRPATGVLN